MQKQGNQNGFTLVELILALSILSLIVTVAYSSVSTILRSKTALDDGREARLIMNSVLNRLTKELQLAYTGIPLLPAEGDLSQGRHRTVNMIGEDQKIGQSQNGDSITFVALEGGQYIPDGGSHSGLVQITYRVEEDPEADGTSNTFYLIREEVPYLRPYERAYQKKMFFPLTKRLAEFDIHYLQRDEEGLAEWVSEWQEEQNRGLPDIVRFSIGIRTLGGAVERLITAVPLRKIN